jgi:hypothetical protein
MDSLQHKYLTTIIGGRLKINSAAVRIILGVPKLSDFLVKLKLSMYYDIFKGPENEFTKQIKANYDVLYRMYIQNDSKVRGLKDQWAYTTADYIKTIDRWNVGEHFKDVTNLPATRNEWMSIVNDLYDEKYRAELETFLDGNGRILSLMFGRGDMHRRHSCKTYGSFLPELKQLYDDNISTTNTSKSIRVLFNWTKLNYLSIDDRGKVIPVPKQEPALCPFCGLNRFKFVANHLIWICRAVERDCELTWANNHNDFARNISFLEGIQAQISRL